MIVGGAQLALHSSKKIADRFRFLQINNKGQETHAVANQIGLADDRPSTEAHAWVELAGRDMGPAPGAYGHRALVRYPIDAVEHDRTA